MGADDDDGLVVRREINTIIILYSRAGDGLETRNNEIQTERTNAAAATARGARTRKRKILTLLAAL